MSKVKAWSWSALSLYEECPARYKYAKIDKLPEPPSEHLERGRKVHKEAEDFLNGVGPLTDNLVLFREEMESLKEAHPIVEQEWAYTKNWKPTGWKVWSGPQAAWLRVKLDAGVIYQDGHADVVDHKTGKNRGGYDDQMRLFALATALRYPEVKTVSTLLWFHDSGEEVVGDYQAATLKAEMADWEYRVKPMFTDTHFAPRPSRKCNWCPFSKGAGGPCQHG